jgi:hypothetical protein
MWHKVIHKKLFIPAIYRRIALTGEIVPGVPEGVNIEKYQTPVDAASQRINDVLVRIFKDSDLHAAVRAYGQRIPFACYKTDNPCYSGFHHLALDPEKRMVVVRQELQYLADHPDETELKAYALFQSDGGIFYVQSKFKGLGEATQWWNEAVLASNDLRGHEFNANFDARKALSSDQVLKSLDAAVYGLEKCDGK